MLSVYTLDYFSLDSLSVVHPAFSLWYTLWTISLAHVFFIFKPAHLGIIDSVENCRK